MTESKHTESTVFADIAYSAGYRAHKPGAAAEPVSVPPAYAAHSDTYRTGYYAGAAYRAGYAVGYAESAAYYAGKRAAESDTAAAPGAESVPPEYAESADLYRTAYRAAYAECAAYEAGAGAGIADYVANENGEDIEYISIPSTHVGNISDFMQGYKDGLFEAADKL